MASETRAWQITRRGPIPKTIKLSDNVTVHPPKAGEIQVKITYASLNPVDTKLAAVAPSFLQKLPRAPGSDFAGVVTAVGEGEQPVWAKAGTRVYGQITASNAVKTNLGSLQELVTIPTKYAQPTPEELDDEHAAGLSLVGLTALVLATPVKAGDRVLIVGGSTSVGLLLADMVRDKGASFVVATASGSKCDFVKKRGIDDVVDYRQVDAGGELALRYKDAPFDYALDCVGEHSVHLQCPKFLKFNAPYLCIGASSLSANTGLLSPELRSLIAWQLRAMVLPSFLGGIPRKFKQTGLDDSRMEEFGQLVTRLVKEDKLHPVVDRTFKFEEAVEAYEYLVAGRALGKVNVKVAA